MKETVTFETAPSIVQFERTLTPEGWKITRHTTEHLHAIKEIGQSEFPVTLATTWHVNVSDTGAGVIISIEVPTFTHGMYAQRRVLDTIRDIAEAVPGECQTEAKLTVDVLSELRDYANLPER